MFGIPKFSHDNQPERQAEIEKPLETEVRLEIFRHSKKDNDPSRPNSELLLTPEGRELAHEKGVGLSPDIRVSIAGASPMDRAAETAMLTMAASEDEIKVDDSLAEMDKKIAQELKFGKKIYRDSRLTFDLSGPLQNAGMAAFKGGRYMEWLDKDSDIQALKEGDETTTTYLRQAGNIAELVKRYEQVGYNFNRLALEKQEAKTEFPNHLERYLATHQGVAECFVAEVLKEQAGAAVKDKFISQLGNGWPETEGISLRIVNSGSEQSVHMSYPGSDGHQEIIVKPETVEKIIRRRETWEKGLQAAKHIGNPLENNEKI